MTASSLLILNHQERCT